MQRFQRGPQRTFSQKGTRALLSARHWAAALSMLLSGGPDQGSVPPEAPTKGLSERKHHQATAAAL